MITLAQRVERIESLMLSLLIVLDEKGLVPDPPDITQLETLQIAEQAALHIMVELQRIIKEHQEAALARSSTSTGQSS
jgi:hypothetical protein